MSWGGAKRVGNVRTCGLVLGLVWLRSGHDITPPCNPFAPSRWVVTFPGRSRTRSPPLPILTTLGKLQLFETVFNTGKPLSGYCQDDPLWPLLAEVASPCSNCSKSPGKCKVLPSSPRCTNCSAKKTCSLGKILQYRYFARRCNQDLAYSHRFLELHGTPAHQSTWGIPLSVWRQYDVALHACTSSTSTLLELNMLDEQDTVDADQQELREFLALQQGEAVVAAKPSTSPPLPPRTSPSLMEVPGGDLPVQGHSSLVQLAVVAEAQSSLVQRPVVPPSIKGTGPDLLSSNMPPASRPTLVPRALAAYPYRAENQRLAARVRLLESQLADSQRENSSLTSALRDTSHALESQQREVEQLRSSHHEVLEHKTEYRRVLDQFVALEEALPGTPGQSLLERFRKQHVNIAWWRSCKRRSIVLAINRPFLTAAQHAGFAPPSDNSLEPPLHRRMLALSTTLPHSDGVGRWDDLVPALPSVDQLTADWEQLMLHYIHHITDVPLSGTDTQVPMSSVEPGTESLAEATVEQFPEVPPLFLPEQESPTSPSPPPPSPTLPPLFG
ncbi:hypothetical protein F5876DRAFT_71213, partial [Lentinula aff. lateritia]